jgi:hypothetical protein
LDLVFVKFAHLTILEVVEEDPDGPDAEPVLGVDADYGHETG